MITIRRHKGWYLPRGLPHFDSPRLPQFVTFRLADSLPQAVSLAREGEGAAEYRRRIEAALETQAQARAASRAPIWRRSFAKGCFTAAAKRTTCTPMS